MFLYQFVRRRRRRRRPQILVHAITFEQLLDFFYFWHDCWPWPVDYLTRFWSIFVVTLTKIFQGQIWNLLYPSQKWSDCHETKSKHIDWTLGLKWDHRVWLWPWPWPRFFTVKYRICYISAKYVLIATQWKANISTELQASNVTNGFDLDHNLDLWILKVKRDLDLWPHTWPWPWIFMVKFWNSCISEWEGRLTLYKGGGSRSFMTMTIWWPRSGVWIYQIVTRVTSVVNVPSTHLVLYGGISSSEFKRHQIVCKTHKT